MCNIAVSAMSLITRQRLLQRINQSLQTTHVFVSAPAGYGKTTLLRSLIAHQPHSYYVALSPAESDLSVLHQRLQAIIATLLDESDYIPERLKTATSASEILDILRTGEQATLD